MRRSFYEGPQPKAGMRQVSDAVFFWSTGRPVPIGFQVPKAHPRDSELEGIFEQVRRRLVPQAPSRMDCIFVCPLPERGFCSHSTMWRGGDKFVYKVSVTGTTFTTDGGYWTEAKFRPERAESWAESYWNPRGRITDNRAEETLVDGKVIVVESLFGWKMPSAERVASRWKAAADLAAWTEAFFRRHPRLKPFMKGLRRVRESTGSSGSHGEARQAGDDILIFPKFWALDPQTQDFVFAHELGHWVLTSRGGTRSLIEKAAKDGVDVWDLDNLPFGQFNFEEGFADSFASYFLDGDVQRRYPLWAKWVEDYL